MNRKKEKFAKESNTVMTEYVLPNDTNPLNYLMGGRLMHWMDIVSAIAAQKHSNRVVVTASVDNVSFSKPIPLGSVVTLNAQVTRSFNSSMEVFIEVWAENIPEGNKFKSHSAYFTFVAVDESGKPINVPDLIPQTKEEIERFESAQKRRELRLVLAQRLNPDQASELKSLFDIK